MNNGSLHSRAAPVSSAHQRRHRAMVGLLLVALLGVSALALAIGPVKLDWARALAQPASADGLILWQLRLPRLLLAAAVGAVLGLAGAALQGWLRNPLAEPGLLGVANGAALGAVLALYYGLAQWAPLSLPLAGLLGAAGATVLVLALVGGNAQPLPLLLAGLAVNTVTTAMIALALNYAPNAFAAQEMLYWLMGSVTDRSWQELSLALPGMALGAALLLASGRVMDALTLGRAGAASLGFDLRREQRRLLLGVALAVGAAVAVTGVIGFVGLLVPHLLRPLLGPRPSQLLAASALAGALLLVLADLMVRALPGGGLRLGVVTALTGGPFFLWLLWRQRGQGQ